MRGSEEGAHAASTVSAPMPDLAAAARPGQVLISSQLGSLLQLADLEPHERLLSTRVVLPDGRPASAFLVQPRRAQLFADRPPA